MKLYCDICGKEVEFEDDVENEINGEGYFVICNQCQITDKYNEYNRER